jgi:hypothetical protein
VAGIPSKRDRYHVTFIIALIYVAGVAVTPPKCDPHHVTFIIARISVAGVAVVPSKRDRHHTYTIAPIYIAYTATCR